MLEKNSFRRRVVDLLGGTQVAAADRMRVSQGALSQWLGQAPKGAIGDLMERALDTLDDEQLEAAILAALGQEVGADGR